MCSIYICCLSSSSVYHAQNVLWPVILIETLASGAFLSVVLSDFAHLSISARVSR